MIFWWIRITFQSGMVKVLLLCCIVLFLLTGRSAGQTLTREQGAAFVRGLIFEDSTLHSFFDKEELAFVHRLGIRYHGVTNKILIANDPPAEIKRAVQSGELKYSFTCDSLEPEYSMLTLKFAGVQQEYEYIFRGAGMITKARYYSMGKVIFTGKYFVVHASDSSGVHRHTLQKLDEFADSMSALLEYSAEERTLLEKEKIHYLLCRDDNEIKRVTGYSARGLYSLADDYIISTYNAHFHEAAHLLMNYKLKHLNLYTHPLLLEGFASGFGGRGGLSADVILTMGAFLTNSGFVDYKTLFERNGFYRLEASTSYAAAGLYIRFLIENIGMKKFLELYRRYSEQDMSKGDFVINPEGLPAEKDWIEYTAMYKSPAEPVVRGIDIAASPKIDKPAKPGYIFKQPGKYVFMVRDTMLLGERVNSGRYQSSIFTEWLPGRKYKGEKYLVLAGGDEISVYNLLTNTLSVKYVRGFTLHGAEVQKHQEYYVFSVDSAIFEEDITRLIGKGR